MRRSRPSTPPGKSVRTVHSHGFVLPEWNCCRGHDRSVVEVVHGEEADRPKRRPRRLKQIPQRVQAGAQVGGPQWGRRIPQRVRWADLDDSSGPRRDSGRQTSIQPDGDRQGRTRRRCIRTVAQADLLGPTALAIPAGTAIRQAPWTALGTRPRSSPGLDLRPDPDSPGGFAGPGVCPRSPRLPHPRFKALNLGSRPLASVQIGPPAAV
ncbi:hypothetical protein JOF56_007740 [Kibdelosporangium banguiense]|uniref:Uncharacterized protein n=1 Tax=Kibdelosporangium banguiense TaxID=1365924 RepID=A0ABS4TSH0_9PSEU|nr:hypothetical protein [Kibdelosporangium banguiense]